MAHEQHRQRIRARFAQNGFEGFSDFELLEVLLFAAHPRANTNQHAHALIERFGSLQGILRARPEVLKTVPEIGDSTVLILKTIPELIRRLQAESVKPVVYYDTISKLVEFLKTKFWGLTEEHVYLLLFDNRMRMLDMSLISKGTVSHSDFSIPKIANAAIIQQAPNAVIAHNHPAGLAYPSENDKVVTECLYNTLAGAGIRLVEHVIWTEETFWPIIYKDYRDLRSIPIQSQVECKFLDSFYDLDPDTFRFPSTYDTLLDILKESE